MLAVFALASVATAEDTPAIRKLDLKDVKLKHEGIALEPAIASTAEELAKVKAFVDDASRAAVKKQVDFAKEKVVVFSWSGSGGDEVTPELLTTGKKLVAVFKYKPGKTDDVQEHGLIVTVPKDAVVEVKK